MNPVLKEIDRLREILSQGNLNPEAEFVIRQEINRLQVSLLGELVMRG